MSDIFREVDQAMQQEKILKIWHEHKGTLLTAFVLLLVGIGVGTAYRNWDASRNAAETSKLLIAMQQPEPAKAVLEVTSDSRKGQKALGLMSVANLYLTQGKKEEALQIYKQIIDSKNLPKDMRNLARLFYVQNSDQADINILKPLLSDEKSPWIWHGRLEAAVMNVHKDKNYAEALSYLKDFEATPYVPFTLKQRAESLRHVYELESQYSTPKTE